MGYNDFFEREDVYQIIQETLDTYYNFDMMSVKKREFYKYKNRYYCIPKLNIIFSKSIDKVKLVKFLINNLVGNQNFLKRKTIIIYILLSVYLPIFFSDRIMITVGERDIDLIYPGNKKLKIIDFKNLTVKNILKTGFDDSWFQNEINFRNNNNLEFILNIRDVTKNSYSEKLLWGKPLARLSRDKTLRYKNVIFKYLSVINRNPENFTIKEYVNKLNINIEKYLISLDKHFTNLESSVKVISDYLLSRHGDDIVGVCNTHGDFQKGNILIDQNERIYILDWETAKYRFCKYDYMVYSYNFRNSYQLIDNIVNYLRVNKDCISALINLAIFILEDIIWHLEETTQLRKENYSIGLNNYNNSELVKFLKGAYNENTK